MENSQQSAIRKDVVAKLGGKMFVSVDYPFTGNPDVSLKAMQEVTAVKLQEIWSNVVVLAWNETFKHLAEQDPRVKVQEIEDASELFF